MRQRMDDLEARRLMLLRRCEEQRLELAYRVAQIKPAAQLTAWTRRSGAQAAANHPIAWVAGLLGLLLMFRPRGLVRGVGWMTGLLALVSRAGTIIRVIAQLRAAYLGIKAARRQQPPR